jgi:hypothetical protein
VLTAWAVFSIAPDFARIFVTFNKLDIQVDNDGRLLGDAARNGEWIDTSCTAWPNRLAVLGGRGGIQYLLPKIEHVTLCIYTELNGPSVLRQFNTTPKKLNYADRVSLVLDQLLGLFFIACGAILVWQAPNATSWGFFLYALWFNPGQNYVLYALLQQSPWIAVTQEIMQGIVEAAGLCGLIVFALRFPKNSVDGPWQQNIERALPFLMVLLTGWSLYSFLTIIGFKTKTVTQAYYLLWLLVVALVLAILVYRRFWSLRSISPSDWQKLRWVFLGCVIGLPAFLFAEITATRALLVSWTPSETTLNLAYLLSAVLPIFVYYAISRHHVVDVRFALSRRLTRPLLWYLVGLAIVGLHRWAEDEIDQVYGPFNEMPILFLALVVPIVFSVLVALKELIDHLHKFVCQGVERLFFKTLLENEQKLADCRLKLENATRKADLDLSLVNDPVRIFKLTSGALFRSHGDGIYRLTVPSIGWPANLPRKLSRDDALNAFNGQSRIAKKRYPWAVEWTADRTKIMPFENALSATAIPLFGDRELIGVVFYGPHSAGDTLNEDELQALGQFLEAGAIAYRRVAFMQLRQKVSVTEA